MAFRRNLSVASIIATIAGLAAAIEVRAGADKVIFPENYASGAIYMTIDRAQSKQVTAYYTSREAIEAAQKGMALPSGTVITAVAFRRAARRAGQSGQGCQRPFRPDDRHSWLPGDGEAGGLGKRLP